MSDLASIPLLQAVGWALLHSLWQGALLALLAAVALRLTRYRSAELRYAITSEEWQQRRDDLLTEWVD